MSKWAKSALFICSQVSQRVCTTGEEYVAHGKRPGTWQTAERTDALLTQVGDFPRPAAIQLKPAQKLATGLVYTSPLLHCMCKFRELSRSAGGRDWQCWHLSCVTCQIERKSLSWDPRAWKRPNQNNRRKKKTKRCCLYPSNRCFCFVDLFRFCLFVFLKYKTGLGRFVIHELGGWACQTRHSVFIKNHNQWEIK